MTWWETLLIACIPVALGLLPNILILRSARRKAKKEVSKVDAEAAKTYAEAADMTAKQNTELQRRIETVEEEVDKLEEEVKEYKKGTKILIAQMRRLDIVPEWTPPNGD